MAERLVVIGGDAGGMAAASQARKLRPDLDIVVLEMGRWTSYSACGIPYVVGGEVDDIEDLVARSPQEFRDRYGMDVRLGHEAVGIDLDRGEVEFRDHAEGRTSRVGFDQLMLGMGARPRRPDLPGIDHPCVLGVQTLGDAADLLGHAEHIGASEVVVVGAGYIGLEMAEAFLRRGAKVTVVERDAEVMRTLDADMGALVREAMVGHGIDVRCGVATTGFSDGKVHTDDGDVAADLVVLGLGVVPNGELAADAGIALGAAGAVAVDRRQRTTAEGVWAAGDCCESYHLVTTRKVHVALGTVANKQSRVAGINIGGGYATFPGVVGTAVTKVCDTEVARTGLSEREAERDGFGCHAVTIESTTRAGYFPGASPLTVKMLAERTSGRLLGAQIVGQEGAAKRIDVVATALHARMTVEEMTHLDLSYAPPFSPVWDPVLVAARKATEAVIAGAAGGGG
ncbi:MAG: FAD-dependent oxidoreductase [Acidimicrobiia bacterium]|nr:FAD-dependent oxidoreductase [Acidimicrobiia bacterium]